jgi:thioredoxin-like negative regulator of GroEL
MHSVLNDLAADMGGKLSIVRVDIEDPENASLVGSYKVHCVPNLKLFHSGAVIHEILGLSPKDVIKGEIEKAVNGR